MTFVTVPVLVQSRSDGRRPELKTLSMVRSSISRDQGNLLNSSHSDTNKPRLEAWRAGARQNDAAEIASGGKSDTMMMAPSWRIALAAELNVLDRDDPGNGFERARHLRRMFALSGTFHLIEVKSSNISRQGSRGERAANPRPHLLDRLPEAEGAVGDRELGSQRKPPPFEVEDELFPRLRALSHAVDEPDKFLFAFGRGADDQQALRAPRLSGSAATCSSFRAVAMEMPPYARS
jgi:hypothetical protein